MKKCSPKCAASMCIRVSFGLSLLLVGITHYMTFPAFKGMTMDGLGSLEMLGALWAFVLPALMIVGGALMAINQFPEIGVPAAGVAIGSIPIGMLLKPVLSGVALPDQMPHVLTAFVWLIVYVLVVKMSCCKGACKTGEGSAKM